jgi:hypothetical protein
MALNGPTHGNGADHGHHPVPAYHKACKSLKICLNIPFQAKREAREHAVLTAIKHYFILHPSCFVQNLNTFLTILCFWESGKRAIDGSAQLGGDFDQAAGAAARNLCRDEREGKGCTRRHVAMT